MPVLRELLSEAIEKGASDVHLKLGREPTLRVHGSLVTTGRGNMTEGDLDKIAAILIPPHLRKRFETESEVDFSLDEESIGRFRVNVFRDRLGLGLQRVNRNHVSVCQNDVCLLRGGARRSGGPRRRRR